ncbi:hypothetical protein V2W45_585964 [Cenococcum geophilum]
MTTNLQTDAANKFYTDSTLTAKFDARIQNVLKYINPNGLNQAWGSATDVLMAVDIQNEPFLQARNLLQTPTGFDWLCGRAQTIKSVAPNLLVSTGGIGGSNDRGTYGPNTSQNLPKWLYGGACPQIDIQALHV